jgi:IMP dehydrogenase
MPIANGDSLGRAMKAEIQDHTKALEVLEKEYTTRDGLDVDTLLDSDKHGALTYNDFLILPGYIGKTVETRLYIKGPFVHDHDRIPCFRCHS